MKVAIRTDASVQIGSGHLSRCLALADAVRNRGDQVTFISRDLAPAFCEQILAQGHSLFLLPTQSDTSPEKSRDERTSGHQHWLVGGWEIDAIQTREYLLSAGEYTRLVLDHYALDKKWEMIVRPTVGELVVIDDLADREHDCDVLIDQNLVQDFELRYEGLVSARCTKLLGPKYAILRPEFASARNLSADRAVGGQRILVFFGGTDPTAETERTLAILRDFYRADLHIDVVVGAANPRRNEIDRYCQSMKNATFHCQITNIASLMATAHISIGAGGTSQLERCCVGLATILIAVAENQVSGAEESARRGTALYLGRSGEVTSGHIRDAIALMLSNRPLRDFYARNASALVDGCGLERVVASLLDTNLSLHPATSNDSEMMFNWRNDKDVRMHSFDQREINWKDHVAWFSAKISNPHVNILIGFANDIPVGVLRYDIEPTAGTAVVSIYLGPGQAGKGVGSRLLRLGSDWINLNCPEVRRIEAHIRDENVVSLKAFENAGFKRKTYILQRQREDD